jgi:hypothetical protein
VSELVCFFCPPTASSPRWLSSSSLVDVVDERVAGRARLQGDAGDGQTTDIRFGQQLHSTDAPKVSISELRPIDLVVCGSVAVKRHGERIGKGAGYSDLEVALLHDAAPRTAHGHLHNGPPAPSARGAPTHGRSRLRGGPHRNPAEVILCRPSRRRTGILWDHLPAEYTEDDPGPRLALASWRLKRKLSNTRSIGPSQSVFRREASSSSGRCT